MSHEVAKAEGHEKKDEGEEKEPKERGACKDCGEHVLDCFAFFGRGTVQGARGTLHCVQRTAYPVKECVLGLKDKADGQKNPYMERRPLQNGVPGFAYE